MTGFDFSLIHARETEPLLRRLAESARRRAALEASAVAAEALRKIAGELDAAADLAALVGAGASDNVGLADVVRDVTMRANEAGLG